jgi:HrpA-like RNA helicase
MRALGDWCGRGRPFVAVPLHSQVAREEQQQAFATFANQRKVIISTNIAESSLTVPDVVREKRIFCNAIVC